MGFGILNRFPVIQRYITCGWKFFDLLDQFCNCLCIQKFCHLFFCTYQFTFRLVRYIRFLIIGQFTVRISCFIDLGFIVQCQIFHIWKSLDLLRYLFGCFLISCYLFQSCKLFFCIFQCLVIIHVTFFFRTQLLIRVSGCCDLFLTLIGQFDRITNLINLGNHFACVVSCTRRFV